MAPVLIAGMSSSWRLRVFGVEKLCLHPLRRQARGSMERDC